MVNARILRGRQAAWVRYSLGALVIVAAAVTWIVLRSALTLATGGLPGPAPPA